MAAGSNYNLVFFIQNISPSFMMKVESEMKLVVQSVYETGVSI